MRNIYCKMLNCLKYTLLSAFCVFQLIAAQQLAGQNIQLTFSSVSPKCNGYTDGTITANPTGGTAPYGYHWANGQSGQTNFGVGAGTYAVTVTDQNGLTATGSGSVTQPSAVVAAITPIDFSCMTTGGTLSASASGGTPPYSYNWTGGLVGQTIPAHTVGAYTVTATDANGCADLENYFVYAPLAVTVEVENIPCFMFCDGVARANVTGGVYPYTYHWNTGATTQQISALPPGWYSVTVIDAAGCMKTDGAFIYEPPAITISFTTITPACGGNTGSATAQANGGTPPFTYLWNYQNTVGPTLSNVPAGTYFVQVKDANGCQKDSSVVIPAGPGLNVTLAIQKATCQGVDDGTVTAVVTGGTGNYSYHWNIQGANTASLNGIAAGTNVCVTVTDNTSGCQGIACDVVGTHTVIGVQVTDTDVNCLGDLTGTATALAYNGTEPYNYVWTYPNNSTVNGAAITGLGAGAYSVIVTDDQGCTAVGVADIGVLSNLQANYELSVVECVGSSIKVQFTDKSTDTGSTIVAWNWHIAWGSGVLDTNVQNPPALNLPSNETGTVQLTVTSAAGCTDFISAPFTVDSLPNVYVNVPPIAFNCDGSPVHIHVTGDPNYTYVWYPGAFLSPDTEHPSPQNVIANPPQDQLYTLVAGNGTCIDTVQVQVLHHTPLTLSVGPHNVVACASTATLTATLNATATVKWFGPNGDTLTGATVTVPATPVPATYVVVATDALGCTQTDSVTVTGKEVSIALNVPGEVFDCDNGPITITVTGAPANTYTWSPTDGLTPVMPGTGSPNVIANPAQTQLYTLTATNGFCSDTAQVNVVRVEPINLSVDHQPVAVCTPTAVVNASVNANANVTSVQWFNPDNDLIATGTTVSLPATATPTWYRVTAQDSLGCTQTDSVLVSGNAISVTVDGPAQVVDCANGPVTLHATGTPGVTYNWSPNVTDPTSPTVTVNPNATTVYQVVASNGACADTAQVEVVRVVPIDLALKDTASLSCLENKELQVTFNLASNAQIIWSNNQTGPSITVPVTPIPTIYTAIATDTYGCKDTVYATVSGHPAAVNITANTPTTLCENDTLSLTAVNLHPGTDILTYHWSSIPNTGMTIDPANQPTVTIIGHTGSYQILVEAVNQFGCRDSEQIPVTFSPGGSLSGAIKVKNCGGLTVDFENKSGMDGTWNFGDGSQPNTTTNPSHTYAGEGSFHVVFTPLNADCVAPFDTTVEVKIASAVNPDIASNLVNCTDVAVYKFTGQATGTNLNWQWTAGGQASTDQNPSFTFNQTGLITAYVTVTDTITGCVGVDSLPVDVQFIDDKIGPDTLVCKGASVQLNPTFNPNFTYTWTANPADPTLVGNNPNPTVTPTDTTTYTVVISNNTGCSVTYSKTVNPQSSTILSAGPDQVVCSDAPLTLAVQNPVGNNYQWSQTPDFHIIIGEGSSIEITPENDGVYYVRTGGTGDCLGLGEVHVDNAEVLVEALPKDRNICLGESTQLVVTNLHPNDPLKYEWSSGLGSVTNPVVTPDSTTSYSVIVTNANQEQCKDTVTFNVNVADLAVTAQVIGKDTICPGQSAQLQATAVGTGTVFTYSWTPAGSLNNPNIPNPIARPDVETVYTVTATADGLCPQTASVKIFFMGDQCVEPSIFVPKAFTPNQDGNNDFFIVRGVNIKELYMVVWDRWGEKVYETNDSAAQGWDGTYQGASLTPDAYAWYVKATCGNGAVYEKKGNVTLLK